MESILKIQILLTVLFMPCFPSVLKMESDTAFYAHAANADAYIDLDGDFPAHYPFNCSNIDDIHILKKDAAGGRYKTVDIGYHNGQKVTIKRVPSVRGRHPWILMEAMLLKDIAMSDQLNHRSLITMLGFCIRHMAHESYSNSPRTPDISAVYEYGRKFNVTDLTLTPFDRLRHAAELADLMHYLDTSPLGALAVYGMSSDNFLLVGDTIKMIDYDLVNDIDCPCKFSVDDATGGCPYNLTCEKLEEGQIDEQSCQKIQDCARGVCKGALTRKNLESISKLFLEELLKNEFFPYNVKLDIERVFENIYQHKITPNKLVYHIEQIWRKIAK